MEVDEPPSEDIWRILVATDVHLGYMERDPIRRDDSFEAFDEILTKAEQEQVDFVLLAGDLFHDNNPSRYTLHRTMAILKEHCFGARQGGHAFEILSEQSVHFQRAAHANMSDENLRIRLPIFSIHGNHDDPGDAALAALDLLHVSSMINYFGKTEVTDEITIPPLMLKKGESVLALYGLGNIRDERLCRMWNSGRVHVAPPELPNHDNLNSSISSGSSVKRDSSSASARAGISRQRSTQSVSSFSQTTSQHAPSSADQQRFHDVLKILVLHQNRVPHSSKNYIAEERVADFDFVVWGHEHESIVTHNTRMDSEPYISQPGSSVATSLSEGETAQKHAVLLEVYKNKYAVTPLPLHSVRPFRLEHINLSEMNLPMHHSELQMCENISHKLAAEVERILAEIASETCIDGSNTSARWTNSKLPLIRLKVNYTGYSVINSKRFGQDFMNRVANPGDILLFSSKRAVTVKDTSFTGRAKTEGGSATSLAEAEALLEIAPQHAKIDEFLQEHLTKNLGEKLGVFQSTGLIRTLQNYAEKEGTSLAETLEKQLKEVQLHVLTHPDTASATASTPTLDRQAITKYASEYHKKQAEKEELLPFKKPSLSFANEPTSAKKGSSSKRSSAIQSPIGSSVKEEHRSIADEGDDYDLYEASDHANTPRNSSLLMGDEWEDDLSTPEKRKRPPSKKTATPIALADASDSPPVKRSSKRASASAKPAAATGKQKPAAMLSISSTPTLTSPSPVASSSRGPTSKLATPKTPATKPSTGVKADPAMPSSSQRPKQAMDEIIVIDSDEETGMMISSSGLELSDEESNRISPPPAKRAKGANPFSPSSRLSDIPLPGFSQAFEMPLSELPSNTQPSAFGSSTSQQIDSSPSSTPKPTRAKRSSGRLSASSQKPTQTSPASMVVLEDDTGSQEAENKEVASSPSMNLSRWGRKAKK